MAAEGRVTLNRGGRNSRFDCKSIFGSAIVIIGCPSCVINMVKSFQD